MLNNSVWLFLVGEFEMSRICGQGLTKITAAKLPAGSMP